MSIRIVDHLPSFFLWTVLSASLLGCGFRPPPEFHEVSEIDEMPLPAPLSPLDAGILESENKRDGGLGENKGVLLIGVGFATISAMPLCQILGKTRDEIETLLAPLKPETREQRLERRSLREQGWVKYSEYLTIRYDENETAVEFTQEVPSDLTCVEAAKWLGFDDAMPPIQAADSCRWPQGDEEHLLGQDVHGKLILGKSLFHAFKSSIPAI